MSSVFVYSATASFLLFKQQLLNNLSGDDYRLKKVLTNNMALLLKILILIFISRLSLCVLGFIGMNTFPMHNPANNINSNISQKSRLKRISLEDFNKFDSGFYFQIVDSGYPKVKMSESTTATRISFFPLYPLLIKLVVSLHIFNAKLVAALFLSNSLLLFALFYVYKIGGLRGFKVNELYLILVLILCYPSSLFYSVPYTESLFLCMSAATIYYSMIRSYLTASIFAGLSSITRFPGFLNIAYVFFLMSSDIIHNKSFNKEFKKVLISMIIAILPILTYFSYMKYLTGDFLAPLHDVNNWGRKLSIPFKSYIQYISNPYFLSSGGWDNGIISFSIATSVLGLFVCYFALYFKTFDIKEYIFLIYGFLLILVPFSNSGSDLVSISRYLMVSIPIYFYAVKLCRKYPFIFLGYLFLFTTLNALITIGYFNGYYFVV